MQGTQTQHVEQGVQGGDKGTYMATLNIISIDGVQLPTPTTYSVEYNDVDASDTGRSEDGMLHRSRVRQGLAKIKLEWRQINTDKAQIILNAIVPDSVSVTYYFGTQKTATMYAGNRSCELVRVNYEQAKWNISFNLVEF